MRLIYTTHDSVDHVEAELDPGELVYDPANDRCNFNFSLNGLTLCEHAKPREWMAIARAMVEAARSARGER